MGDIYSSRLRHRMKQGRTCVVHSGKVYDVTDFLPRHPGGAEILSQHTGQDVSTTMQNADVHKHTKHALTILDKYYIGDLKNDKNNSLSADSPDKRSKDLTAEDYFSRKNGYKDPVDWSKPVLSQIPKLGKHYFEWVHQPTDLPLRLFHSDFVEYFSKCPWWMVPFFWVPTLLMVLSYAFNGLNQQSETFMPWAAGGIDLTVYRMPVIFCMGTLSWTFLEYVIHRWLFHLKPPMEYPRIVQLHFILHGQHHKCPMEKGRLVFPIVPACVLATCVTGIYLLIFPLHFSCTLISGTILGYICYDLTHYYLHHGSPSLNYFKNLKRYHVKHHFEQQHRGFGISSKMWDYPFNTLISE